MDEVIMNPMTEHQNVSHALGLAMIWNGAMGALLPTDHCLALRAGPRWWRNTVDWFAARPQVTRSLGIAELAAGLWLTRETFGLRPANRRRHRPVS
jgi:hypothetical protein